MEALLLDLDDTLLDYSGDVDRSWSDACATCVTDRGVDPAALVAAIAGVRRWFWSDPDRHRRERVDMPRAWRNIVVHAMSAVGIDDAALATAIAEAYAESRRERMCLFPDALACLERWRRDGVSLGLVTNGDAVQQRYKIERYDLAKYFEVMVIEGEFGAGKPDEVVYRHALDALRARADAAWMVGDNLEFDVIAPQRLGLRGVWIDRRGDGLPDEIAERPHRIIRALTDLVDGA